MIDNSKLLECQREIDQAIANIALALTATVEQLAVLNAAYHKAKGVIGVDKVNDVPPV